MSQESPVPISQELDDLCCELLGCAFDALADGMDISVLVSYETADGKRMTSVFNDDSEVACLEGAQEFVKTKSKAVRYGLVYVGSVALVENNYEDALILEYGEKGLETGFSAYSLISGVGEGEQFMWSEPTAAGETELLV